MKVKAPVIKMNCGQQGCDITKYVQPYGGIVKDFQRHIKEGFKVYPKKQAA